MQCNDFVAAYYEKSEMEYKTKIKHKTNSWYATTTRKECSLKQSESSFKKETAIIKTKFLNNWLAVQNLRIALKKAVFALGFKEPSVIKVIRIMTLLCAVIRVMTEGFLKPNANTAFFKAVLNLKNLVSQT